MAYLFSSMPPRKVLPLIFSSCNKCKDEGCIFYSPCIFYSSIIGLIVAYHVISQYAGQIVGHYAGPYAGHYANYFVAHCASHFSGQYVTQHHLIFQHHIFVQVVLQVIMRVFKQVIIQVIMQVVMLVIVQAIMQGI